MDAETTYDRVTRLIREKVSELNTTLGLVDDNSAQSASFGYIGNGAPGPASSVIWYVFLPHPGRTATAEDRIGGFRTYDEYGARSTLVALNGAIKGAQIARGMATSW